MDACTCRNVADTVALGQISVIALACVLCRYHSTYKLNFVALVCERTIPTERPPPAGEVSAKFLRIEGCHVVSATDPHDR